MPKKVAQAVQEQPEVAQEQAVQEVQELEQFDAAKFIASCGSKSAAIRALTAQGKSRTEVAKMLGLRYQHVRNVLITPLKRGSKE